MPGMSRRAALLGLPGLALAIGGARAQSEEWVIYRSPGCGCCHKWAEHMQAAGFKIKLEDVADLNAVHTRLGVPEPLKGCHAGMIDGYVIEGHIPAADVKRLLAERPTAKGLSVPGMPMGSPGMDMGPEKEPYEVLLFQADGASEVFARYT